MTRVAQDKKAEDQQIHQLLIFVLMKTVTYFRQVELEFNIWSKFRVRMVVKHKENYQFQYLKFTLVSKDGYHFRCSIFYRRSFWFFRSPSCLIQDNQTKIQYTLVAHSGTSLLLQCEALFWSSYVMIFMFGAFIYYNTIIFTLHFLFNDSILHKSPICYCGFVGYSSVSGS